MKERPILFNGPMVRALLDGQKTQTRRAVKGFALELLQPDNFTPEYVALPENRNCPYGYSGDRLWVREAFRFCAEVDDVKPRDIDAAYRVWYEADAPRQPGFGKLRPSMFMPRWASRITLEIVSVHVDRLQDISEADAESEGTTPSIVGADLDHLKFCAGYQTLWESLNGAGSWAANPWVWVVEFRRLP